MTLLKHTEREVFATVVIAYCWVETDVIRAVFGGELEREFAASRVSLPRDPSVLRIEAVLPWKGEPIC